MHSTSRMAPKAATVPEESGTSGQPYSTPPGYQVLRGRRPVLVPTSARLFPGSEWQVRLVNVSVGGVACECEAVPKVGSQIVLQIQGLGQIPALVRWSDDRRFGARFNGRIDVPEKELIAKLLGLSRERPVIVDEPNSPETAEDNSNRNADGGSASPPGWEFEIEQIHAYQSALLDKLELLTARPSPDQAALTDLRVKLVRATRERLDLLQTRVLPDLEKAASPKIANMIARLRAKIDAIRGASAQQIGTWSLDKILSDWSGYCAASEKMRSRIRSQITAEQEVIYLARRYMGRRSGEKD